MDYPIDNKQVHKKFLDSDRSHILMITNHGIHQWNVISGLPDTGGQNVYVNQLTQVLADFGFKITIANRGGYPHPQTGEQRRGLHYKDQYQRIVYLEDSTKDFVRKEDMKSHIPELTDFLHSVLEQEDQKTDLIISHYWDAALLGVQLNKKLEKPVQHLWIPHSLGAVKKRNMPPETWEDLRVDERIATERDFIAELDHVAATSSLIRDSLKKDYGREMSLFLPPCVNPQKYYPREVESDNEIWDFLRDKSMPAGSGASGSGAADGSGKNGTAEKPSKEELRNSRYISEISRTDQTKRKDVLIRAFAEVKKTHPELRLIVSIEESVEALYKELTGLIRELGVEESVIVIGHEAARLPTIYGLTAVYCSPSVMEGFGMSVQEAAAEAVPVVGSEKIPFVTEYLLGEDYTEQQIHASPRAEGKESEQRDLKLKIGDGAIVAPSDSVAAFTQALDYLLDDEKLRREMGRKALNITVPYFTWEEMTRRLLQEMGVSGYGT